jgi:hypothetical protein
VFRSHRPIFGRIDHGTLSRIHSPDLSRSEEWDAQKGPNQREISMKPNALRWHFDQPSLHLRPHGVQRFIARPSLSISMSRQHDAMINGIFVQRNERQWHGRAAQSGRGLFERRPKEFTEVESGKRAVAETCMDNRRATVPFSEVKDAVEGGRLKAIWSQRGEPLYNTERAHRCLAHRCERRVGRTAPTGVACLESTLPCREGQSPGCGGGRRKLVSHDSARGS